MKGTNAVAIFQYRIMQPYKLWKKWFKKAFPNGYYMKAQKYSWKITLDLCDHTNFENSRTKQPFPTATIWGDKNGNIDKPTIMLLYKIIWNYYEKGSKTDSPSSL